MLRQCATTVITAARAASIKFAMAAMLGRLVAQLKMPRLDAYGAGGDVVCAMDTGTNCGTLAAVWAGKAGPGGDSTVPSRSRASLR